jgi:hypothetical protein
VFGRRHDPHRFAGVTDTLVRSRVDPAIDGWRAGARPGAIQPGQVLGSTASRRGRWN